MSNQNTLILDMVHHNPGEELYKTEYEKPAFVREAGFNGKVYHLFDSPMLAINWDPIDPDILPQGTADRRWVEGKAARIRKQHDDCHANGILAYAMADLILFPRRLIEKYDIEDTFGDARNPLTVQFLKAQIEQTFAQFPKLDGLVFRIGETYLHDAPYHQGSIHNKNSVEDTIIPLMNLLREEICVKHNKSLIFRTWLSFDIDSTLYQRVSDSVETHPNLIIAVKHCEGDFHRANPFSKVIGLGRHRQIIEVQCAREYEGKGAYPNYIAHGVIEGFEEHSNAQAGQINSIRKFAEESPELFAGIWTWSRGGGWGGPYIRNELWCDLNAWVMAQWAQDITVSEESIFESYAVERLHLQAKDVKAFRRLCLLSADAVVRGRNSTSGDMNIWWTRDQGIAWPETCCNEESQARNLRQKDESISIWKEIVEIAESIQWPDDKAHDFVQASVHYGLKLYEIYRTIVNIADADSRRDLASLEKWIDAYDEAWNAYNKLPEQFSCLATLYTKNYSRWIEETAHARIEHIRSNRIDS